MAPGDGDVPLVAGEVAVVGLDHVAVGDVALAQGHHGHVIHDGHLHVEAVAAPLLPLGPRDGELVALLHHAHGDTRPALTGAGHNCHYLESRTSIGL